MSTPKMWVIISETFGDIFGQLHTQEYKATSEVATK